MESVHLTAGTNRIEKREAQTQLSKRVIMTQIASTSRPPFAFS